MPQPLGAGRPATASSHAVCGAAAWPASAGDRSRGRTTVPAAQYAKRWDEERRGSPVIDLRSTAARDQAHDDRHRRKNLSRPTDWIDSCRVALSPSAESRASRSAQHATGRCLTLGTRHARFLRKSSATEVRDFADAIGGSCAGTVRRHRPRSRLKLNLGSVEEGGFDDSDQGGRV